MSREFIELRLQHAMAATCYYAACKIDHKCNLHSLISNQWSQLCSHQHCCKCSNCTAFGLEMSLFQTGAIVNWRNVFEPRVIKMFFSRRRIFVSNFICGQILTKDTVNTNLHANSGLEKPSTSECIYQKEMDAGFLGNGSISYKLIFWLTFGFPKTGRTFGNAFAHILF